MPIVKPTNRAVLEYKGLHLYHSDRSNCSARVRLLLEEKELPWVSHQLSLMDKENVTEEYFGINPKGLVPALIHDGVVVTESNDILFYLEDNFPEPSFRNVPDKDQSEINWWLKKSGDVHLPGIKTLQYYNRLAKMLKKSNETYERYQSLQKDPELKKFHAKHGAPGSSLTQEDADGAKELMDGVFEKMESALSKSEWIVGDTYTLADISWGPTYTTMTIGGFDFDRYTNIQAWYKRVSARPQFYEANLKWISGSPWGHEKTKA
ncbi:MAG: glutathione S-transferase family protein [Planktomarina sp.]|nr:glutathione S-transferase family protein [Planktomarina sp.]